MSHPGAADTSGAGQRAAGSAFRSSAEVTGRRQTIRRQTYAAGKTVDELTSLEQLGVGGASRIADCDDQLQGAVERHAASTQCLGTGVLRLADDGHLGWTGDQRLCCRAEPAGEARVLGQQ